MTNNKGKKEVEFTILPELDISLAELQRHVTNSPTAKRSYSYPVSALIVAIGIGLYFAFGNEKKDTSTALIVPSVNKTTELSPLAAVQAPELSTPKKSNISGSKVKTNHKALPTNSKQLGAADDLQKPAYPDLKSFNAVCGKDVFLALEARIDMMPLLEPSATDQMNGDLMNITIVKPLLD